MCGIYAHLSEKKIEYPEKRIEHLIELLKHRGPDDQSVFQESQFFLLHTRLKIIDLRDSANQPFHSACGRFVLVYNGECYNFKELKHELLAHGVVFKTDSDTEVILNAFIEWGISCVNRIQGMFSFVVYDKKEQRLFAARDRIGIKPLYYTTTPSDIIFSSEIKPLLHVQPATLNEGALWSYFNLRYVAGEETLFKNIHEVEPGSWMECRGGKIIQTTRYWDLRNIKPINSLPPAQDFLQSFESVVQAHLQADVSIGALLSGGIDSSAITLLASKKTHELRAYTFSTGLQNDEYLKAQALTQSLGISHERISLQGSPHETYSAAIEALEDPIGDSILFPTLLLMKGVGQHHRLVLSGEGADEVFASYVHQHFLGLEEKIIGVLPAPIRKAITSLLKLVPHQVANLCFPYPAKLGKSGWHKVISHFNDFDDEFERYMSLVQLFPYDKQYIFNSELQRPVFLKTYWESMPEFTMLDRLKRFDMKFWARNYTLHRLDKLSMAQSIEARVPFFDHTIVEKIFRIKSSEVFFSRDPKTYFRQSMKTTPLAENIRARKKQAFFLPVEKVFAFQEIQSMKDLILSNAPRRGIYNQKNLENFLHSKRSELLDAKKLLALYNFEIWATIFLDNKRRFQLD